MPTYNDQLEAYIRQAFAVEDEILRQIRATIPERGLPVIFVRPEEGLMLQFLAAASNAKMALELGTLGGYSGVWIARGMASDGKLITIEKIPEHAQVARENFQLAGVADRVEVWLGDSHELLPDLSRTGPYDFIFIDAEKEGYGAYLDWSLDNLRPGGILAAHNAFRHGAIVDPKNEDPGTDVIRRFNQRLATEPRLISTIFPAGDGMAIAVLRTT
jgi:caffeoyl-CoA O-methyltransferase